VFFGKLMKKIILLLASLTLVGCSKPPTGEEMLAEFNSRPGGVPLASVSNVRCVQYKTGTSSEDYECNVTIKLVDDTPPYQNTYQVRRFKSGKISIYLAGSMGRF
jgi:hypothetical protein